MSRSGILRISQRVLDDDAFNGVSNPLSLANSSLSSRPQPLLSSALAMPGVLSKASAAVSSSCAVNSRFSGGGGGFTFAVKPGEGPPLWAYLQLSSYLSRMKGTDSLTELARCPKLTI